MATTYNGYEQKDAVAQVYATPSNSGSGEQHMNTARAIDINHTGKTFWQRIWPAMACGSGLFSDGYLNGVIGSVNTMLKQIYGAPYKNSPAQSNVSSITFAGTVVGMLFFGWTSDNISRKWSLTVSTIMVIVFAAIATGSYGTGPTGPVTMLVVARFFLGIGIGGEYPAGSVACAESTGELKEGTRNKWFILFTNVAIDIGFVVAAIVPTVLVAITGEGNLGVAWRVSLGFGVFPPLLLLWLRLKLQEPEAFKQSNTKKVITPYWLSIKLYGFRFIVVALIWFIYDFSSYSFGNYSSSIIANALGDKYPLWQSFAWNILINFFYVPGAIFGSFISDRLGPRKTLTYFVALQGIVGFIMTGVYNQLNVPDGGHIAGFCIIYGLFLSLGEVGPGDNIGLLAAKTSATPIRGRYYGAAAAIGKIGAFVGNYVFPYIEAAAGKDAVKAIQYPFYVSSALCIFSAFLAFFFLPEVGQDTVEYEDSKYREYLQHHGWDTRQLDGSHVNLIQNEHMVEAGKPSY